MASLKALVTFVFTLFCVKFIVAAAICDSKDEECTKARAKEAFTLFVSGIDNLVESSDPIKMGLVKASLPTLKYELRDYKMSGLKRCDVTLMSVLKTNSSFQFHLHCPSLVVNADYTLLGHIEDNNMFVEGEGKFTVKLDDYILMINGIYELTTGNDDKKHVHIKNYFIEVNPRGKVVFNFENMFGGDKEKSDVFNDYLNQHWSEMDKALRAPALYTLMDSFIKNLNEFLAVLPVEQIFPEHTKN